MHRPTRIFWADLTPFAPQILLALDPGERPGCTRLLKHRYFNRLAEDYAGWMQPDVTSPVSRDPRLAINSVLREQNHSECDIRGRLFEETRRGFP
jgi:hypothetical protein